MHTFLAILFFLFFHGEPMGALVPAPQAAQVCVTVNRLNVRAGPGTQFAVVSGLVYGECYERLEVSADGAWVRVEAGWAAAQYLRVEAGAETLTATVAPSQTSAPLPASTGIPAQVAEAAVVSTPEGRDFPAFAALRSFLSRLKMHPAALTQALTGNPLKAVLVVVCFYLGLVAAQKFSLLRQLYVIPLVLATVAGILAIWQFSLGKLPQLRIPSDWAGLSGMFVASLLSYLSGLGLGIVIYRPAGKTERGADTTCGVCGRLQREKRMQVCSHCHQPYCNFPAWTRSSWRSAVDGVALYVAIPLGLILTAFSILGGVLVLAMLALPYIFFRTLLPENRAPEYWRACGYGGVCGKCSAKLAPAAPFTDGDSGGSGYGGRDSSNDWEERDRDRSSSSGGSPWGGWLFDFGKKDEREDEED